MARPDDTRFDPAAAPGLVARRAMTGHLLVQPKIDGREIGWFIFDTTAAANLIDANAAATLKLDRLGSSTVTSMNGSEQSSILLAKSLVLGPMTMTKPLFVTMNLGAIQKMMGNDVVGIVGYDASGALRRRIHAGQLPGQVIRPNKLPARVVGLAAAFVQSSGAGHPGDL